MGFILPLSCEFDHMVPSSFLFLCFGLAAFATASPYGGSPPSSLQPTFDKCDQDLLDEQAATITSLSLDPYPIKFDCEGPEGDHDYCGPPYQMTTSLKVSTNIPQNSTLELVLKIRVSTPLGSLFLPIPCTDKLPPSPPVPTRGPRTTTPTTTTTGPTTTTKTSTATTSTTTTTPWTFPPVVPCSFDFNTIFCGSKHTTAPWCQTDRGYPLAGENYTIASSFDVPWLIALLPGLATDILAGSYQLEFRVKAPGESEAISCSTIGITIVDPNPPTTTTPGSTTSKRTEAPPKNIGIPSFSPAIIFTLVCAFLASI